MSTCLTDTELQKLADGEPGAGGRAHVEDCASCRDRFERRRAAAQAFAEFADESAVPPSLGARVEAAVRSNAVAGATTLRHREPRRIGWRQVGLVAAATATVVLVVYAVLPRLGAPPRLSAAEVIGRSVQAIGNVSGVERLEYELRVDGTQSPLFAGPGEAGIFVRQVIDHDRDRFLFAKYGADGTLLAGMAEDPTTGLRVMIVRVNGRRYVARLALPEGRRVSIPRIVRGAVRTWLGIVQASGARNLTLTTSPEGGRFVVQAPELAAAPASDETWSLQSARVVIDATDYHLVEADTRGQVLGSPYHVSFRLTHRQVDATAPDSDFVFPPEPGDVVLEGQASDNPFWDVGVAALQRIGR